MAKKALFTALCLLICIGRIAQSEAARPWPPSGYSRQGPILPGMPTEVSDSKLRKCFHHMAYRCVTEIMSETLTVEPDCCEILEEFDDQECFYGADEECSDTVCARLRSPSFKLFLKEHCSNIDKYEFEDWDDFGGFP